MHICFTLLCVYKQLWLMEYNPLSNLYNYKNNQFVKKLSRIKNNNYCKIQTWVSNLSNISKTNYFILAKRGFF